MKKILLLFVLLHSLLMPYKTLRGEDILKNIEIGRIFCADKDGYIFTNYRSHVIKKYSKDGKLILEIGREGRGPGDINRLAWFSINPKDEKIYVTELTDGNKWISIFSKNGKFLDEWDIELDRTIWTGLSFIKFDKNGNAFLMATRTHWSKYKDFQLGKVERVIFKFLPDGKKTGLIYGLQSDFWADKNGKSNITIPFHNYVYYDLWNDYLAIRESWHDYISIYNLEGRLIKKLFLPFKREKVTKKDIAEWEEWLKSSPSIRKKISQGILDLNYWKKNLPFPGYKPVSGGKIFFDHNGGIFTKKFAGFTEGNPQTWVKINIKTGQTTYKQMKKNEYLLYVTKKSIYLLRIIDDENHEVVRVDRNEYGF